MAKKSAKKSSQFSKQNKPQATASQSSSSPPIAPKPSPSLSVSYNPLGSDQPTPDSSQKQSIAPKSSPSLPVSPNPLDSNQSNPASPPQHHSVLPEEMSLRAYGHIQECLNQRPYLSKKEVNAVLSLSQHLRVFGLLSAVGYLNHAKDGVKTRLNKPMWMPLLWRLVCADQPRGSEAELMVKVEQMARHEPSLYMVTWRKSLIWSNHWNFWAKAHQQEELDESTEHSTVTY